MLQNNVFAQATVLDLAGFMHRVGYEELLSLDKRNPEPHCYAAFWRQDDVQVCHNLEGVRKLAQAIYDGSHVQRQYIPLSEKPHPDYCLCDRCAAERFAYCGYED